MEIMTPPISPTHETTSTSNYLRERGNIGFHCVSDAEKKASFDPRGFIMSGAITNPSSLHSKKSSFVTVFNQEFDMDTSKDELKRLFRVCWNKLCLIDSTQKMGTYGFTSDTSTLATVNLDEVRQDLREFFAMLHLFVESQGESEDKSWILKETLPTLLKGLDLLRNQIGSLNDLPNYVLSHSQVKNSPGHHLFHCHLEARWLHISVLWALSECLKSTSIFEATEIAAMLQPYSAEQSIENLLQSTIRFCIIDLVEIAVLKFNKLNQDRIVHSSPFNCMCVKELWLLLRFITESLNDHDTKAFWKLLDECLQLVVKADADIPSKKGWRPLQTKKFQKIACLEPGLFALWLLRDIGEVYMYSSDGFLSPIRPEMDKGQGIVKCVLNDLMGSNDLEEPQRRTLIYLMKGFLVDPWKTKPEPIMMLWDGFSRKLDCAFQLPGAPASSFVVPSETIEDILSSVEFDRPSNKPRVQLNSFELFLSLLATYLAQDKNVWKAKICGRFFSKLSEKKINSLSEMGLFHLTQIFLSIALATEEVEELGHRFFSLVSFSETDKKRNQMIMKAKLCFVFLLVKNGKELSPLAGPLTNTIDSLIARNQNPVVQVFISNLECLIKNTDVLPSDLHILFGPWVKRFLQQNNQDSTTLRSLLNLMIDVMQKLQVYMDCNNIVGGGMQKLVERLHENLLPYLKDQKSHDWEIADLAFQFTLISLEFSSSSTKESFQNLVHLFTTNDNSKLVKRYLDRLLSCRKITNIIDTNESLQILFVQAWVRCCVCSNVGQDRETEVMQKIFSMPVLKNTFNLPHDNFVTVSDPLLYLVEAMGKTSSSHKKMIVTILEPLRQMMPLIKSSLFPTKAKDSSWVPGRQPFLDTESIERSYVVLGTLVAECPSFIYEKNNASNFLVTLVNYLILHPNVFNMDVRLPLPMENGLRKSLFSFIKGLFKLDPKREKCIERFIKNIIMVYVPRYLDPFKKIWDEPEDMPAAIYIIQSVCETFLKVDKNNVPHKYYCQGLTLMNSLIQRNGCDEILIGLLINNVLPSCLYVVAKVTDMSAGNNRRPETEKTLGLIFDTEVFRTSTSLREQATNVLNQQSRQFLSFHANLFMRMLLFLMKVSKPLVKSFYPTLEANVRDVISKRGSGNDKNLETFLAKVKEGLQV
ncbi:protein MMS22-like [Thrips palmi]|uniref:Protein MMS22-like n=1 Tax=Thrips palmi TaxID=161013 RepID=A0A6P8ZGV7_THRPL|nr:protein MMS22-like [Thrips palmi]